MTIDKARRKNSFEFLYIISRVTKWNDTLNGADLSSDQNVLTIQ